MRKSVETALSSASLLVLIFVFIAVLIELNRKRIERNEEAAIENSIYPNWREADHLLGEEKRYTEEWISLAVRRRNVVLLWTADSGWKVSPDQSIRDTVFKDTIYFRLRD